MTHELKAILSSACRTVCTLAAGVVFAAAPGLNSAQTLDAAARHDQVTARLQVLPEHSLKALYLGCSREAIRRQLGSGEVAACSVVYETLLRRSFGGDFMALLAWSRTQRDDATAEGLRETMPSRNVQALQP